MHTLSISLPSRTSLSLSLSLSSLFLLILEICNQKLFKWMLEILLTKLTKNLHVGNKFGQRFVFPITKPGIVSVPWINDVEEMTLYGLHICFGMKLYQIGGVIYETEYYDFRGSIHFYIHSADEAIVGFGRVYMNVKNWRFEINKTVSLRNTHYYFIFLLT